MNQPVKIYPLQPKFQLLDHTTRIRIAGYRHRARSQPSPRCKDLGDCLANEPLPYKKPIVQNIASRHTPLTQQLVQKVRLKRAPTISTHAASSRQLQQQVQYSKVENFSRVKTTASCAMMGEGEMEMKDSQTCFIKARISRMETHDHYICVLDTCPSQLRHLEESVRIVKAATSRYQSAICKLREELNSTSQNTTTLIQSMAVSIGSQLSRCKEMMSRWIKCDRQNKLMVKQGIADMKEGNGGLWRVVEEEQRRSKAVEVSVFGVQVLELGF